MNIFKPRTKERICFIHVPKCGGQSVKSGIAQAYNSTLETVRMKAAPSLNGSLVLDSNGEVALHQYREYLLRYFLSDPDVGLVMGHYPCRSETLKTFSENWKFVTILRNPVDRFISHFLYNTHKPSEHFRQNASLDEFLKSHRAIASGEIYVRYFSNYPNGSLEEGISMAKQNLDLFSLVGVLEELEEWKKAYQSSFAGKLRIGKSNPSPSGAKQAKANITEDQMVRIVELCKPSMEIYKHVLETTVS